MGISEKSREITTFITKKGLFRYTRLMFGINCAPEIFQKIMEQILNGCEGCLVFIDDILVHGPNQEVHDSRVSAVLKRLKEFNVLLNKEKCALGLPEIEFLGHHLSGAGIKPQHDKVVAVRAFRKPNTAEEVRSFLGLVNFVSKFIPHVATITEPLRKLTRQHNGFEWGEAQQQAFEQLKIHLTKASTLGYFDVGDRTQIYADASPVGLGAVLIQFKNSEPRVISYASRSLTATERRYAQTEKEALALVWAVERFHFYIFGKEFELVTDHKPLEVIFGPRAKPCARIERWVLRIQSYKYKVIYKPGKSNIADPLSRLVEWQDNQNKDSDVYVKWIISHAEPKAIKIEQIESESAEDKVIQSVKTALDENSWGDEIGAYKTIETELCFSNNILLRGNRIVLPESLRARALELGHEGHPGMTIMKKRLRAKVWWPKMDGQIEKFVKQCKGCTLVGAPNAPEPLRPTELPSKPWQHIAIDFCGPLPSGHHLFVIVDYYSRFTEVEIMEKIDSARAIAKLKIIFARFGLPLSITADNGRQFVSHEFKNFCETNNIKLISTTPYWPQQNGEVERQNRSLLKRLAISQEAKRDWKDDLNQYLLMYRSSPHSTTQKPPAEMLFNWNIRDKLPCMDQPIDVEKDEGVRETDREKKEKMKSYSDTRRNSKTSTIKVGDLVILKRQISANKLATTFEPTQYRVVEKKGSELVVENIETLTKYRRNVAHAKLIENGEELAGEGQTNSSLISDNSLPHQVNTPPQPGADISNEQSIVDESAQRNQEQETETATSLGLRCGRKRKAPERFQDYEL